MLYVYAVQSEMTTVPVEMTTVPVEMRPMRLMQQCLAWSRVHPDQDHVFGPALSCSASGGAVTLALRAVGMD